MGITRMCEAYRNLKTEIWCILRCYGWRIKAASARDQEGATSKVGQKPARWDKNQESVASWKPNTESVSRNREKSTISNITERSKKLKTEN